MAAYITNIWYCRNLPLIYGTIIHQTNVMTYVARYSNGPTLIIHRSDAFGWDWCLIGINSRTVTPGCLLETGGGRILASIRLRGVMDRPGPGRVWGLKLENPVGTRTWVAFDDMPFFKFIKILTVCVDGYWLQRSVSSKTGYYPKDEDRTFHGMADKINNGKQKRGKSMGRLSFHCFRCYVLSAISTNLF